MYFYRKSFIIHFCSKIAGNAVHFYISYACLQNIQLFNINGKIAYVYQWSLCHKQSNPLGTSRIYPTVLPLLNFVGIWPHNIETPALVRSPIFRNVEPDQYINGWPLGNTMYCGCAGGVMCYGSELLIGDIFESASSSPVMG